MIESLLIISILLSVVIVVILIITVTKLSLQSNSENLLKIQATIEKLESSMRDEIARSASSTKQEFANQFKFLSDIISSRMSESANAQREQLETFSKQLNNLMTTNSENHHRLTLTIENNLSAMRTENNEKIEKIRATVEEKLHETLDKKLAQSFQSVSERLELVHKGLGEMQSLAAGVGDLKRVLSNVKTRGILGEIQLENILEQMLSTEQYAKNIATKDGSRDVVEFAIKLPGKDDSGKAVYIPIDSKFPLDVYNALLIAYDSGEQGLVDEAGKQLETTIKKCAKDIRDKYIDPPNTTDFAIMFLPVEGLYAEVVRRSNLFEILSRDYKINITGPTTLSALLNSLQMGFRTLAIEKRSSEVWNILGAVKTEFMRFGDVLANAQKKITQANQEIDNLVGTRTRQIIRRLEKINQLPQEEAQSLLPQSEED